MVENVNAVQTIDTGNLVKRADYNTTFEEIENKVHHPDKYITTTEYNKLTIENFAEGLKQANLGNKNDFFHFLQKNWWETNKT